MIGSSKNSTENYPRKCFSTQEKETRVKFNPGLSANRPSNNWVQDNSLWSIHCTLTYDINLTFYFYGLLEYRS